MQSDRHWLADFIDDVEMRQIAQSLIAGTERVEYLTVKDLVENVVLPYCHDELADFKAFSDFCGTPDSTRILQARMMAVTDLSMLPEPLRTEGVSDLISTIYAIAIGVPNLTYPNLEDL